MRIKDLVPFNIDRGEDLFRFDSERPFYNLQREMNRLFDNFSKGFPEMSFFGDKPGFDGPVPRLDLTETEKDIQVSLELPGMDEKDIDISLSNEVLTIKGEKKMEKEEKKKEFYRMERSYGKFQRSIPLPAKIKTDKVEARFKKGVLTVTLPKTEEAKTEVKKISVKAD